MTQNLKTKVLIIGAGILGVLGQVHGFGSGVGTAAGHDGHAPIRVGSGLLHRNVGFRGVRWGLHGQ